MLKSLLYPLYPLLTKHKQAKNPEHIISFAKFEALKQLWQEKKSLSSPSTLLITGEDVGIVQNIRTATKEHNVNNVTRTQAYWDFFTRHPEIHWTLLAHFVSRNGGYHMTDLKGDLVGSLLSPSKKRNFFHFLERANALIFHDAFPQLLLYEKSKQHKKNFFHLLPAFSVSSFMSVIWNDYLQTRNDDLLTVSLIINEQHYIEKRVISSEYAKNVLDTWQFMLQNLFGLTQVIIPYYKSEKIRLSGMTIQHFDSVAKRIEIGKALYSLLFHNPTIKKGATQFAALHPHTSSRSDFAPSFFTSKNERFQKIYSPPLSIAWDHVEHTYYDRSDWLVDTDIKRDWFRNSPQPKTDITDDYFNTLQSLFLMKEHLPPFWRS